MKRIFDLLLVLPGLIITAPLFFCVSLLIKLDSPGPIFFRQNRVGRDGKIFKIIKFRSMVVDPENKGIKVTVGNDPRITKIGCLLRKYKLDEIPQLLNVLKGEMSFVGPRPEVPEYVAYYPEQAKKDVLSVPPGITDFASLHYINENELLASAQDPHKEYIEKIIPIKLTYYQQYIRKRTVLLDIYIIVKTIISIGR